MAAADKKCIAVLPISFPRWEQNATHPFPPAYNQLSDDDLSVVQNSVQNLFLNIAFSLNIYAEIDHECYRTS